MSMELMTIEETAHLLKVSPVTVRRYIAIRRLPAVRVGKGVRVRKEDAENLPMAIGPGDSLDFAPKGKRAKAFSMQDSLWNLVGIASSQGPGDVSSNKHKYLAEAYADTHNGQ